MYLLGLEIFKSENPKKYAKAIVEASCFYNDPKKLLEISRGLGLPMDGIRIDTLLPDQRFSSRGW